MVWLSKSSPIASPVFVVWRTVDGVKKGRVVVDVRGLNAVTKPNLYPVPL